MTSYLKDFVDLSRWPGFIFAGLSFGSYFSQTFWPSDLASHFAVQYLVILAPLTVTAWLARRWRLAFLFGLPLTINALLVAPLFTSAPAPNVVNSTELKVLQVNVNSKNNDFGAFTDCLEKADADVVCVEEVNMKWQLFFQAHLEKYAYQSVLPREDNFGIAILSKLPLNNVSRKSFGKAGVKTLVADVATGGRALTIICTHPLPPTSYDNFQLRNGQLDDLAEFVSTLKGNVVLCGDLNVTMWSHAFTQFLSRSHLEDSAPGFGLQPTWPTNCFLFWIPIDQILVSREMVVLDRRIAGSVGSDHFPVLPVWGWRNNFRN